MQIPAHTTRLLAAALAAALPGLLSAYGPPDHLTFGFDDLTEWQGLESTLDLAKEGVQAGLWTDPATNTRIRTRSAKLDLATCESLTFLVHSAVADGGTFAVIAASKNDETEKPDYYVDYVTVSWEGWSEVTLPLAGFETAGEPLGWHRIDEIGFSSEGFGIPGDPVRSDLVFDAMTFQGVAEAVAGEPAPGEGLVPDEYAKVFGFEDFAAWRGLVPDSEEPREGTYSGRWEELETNNRVQCRSFPQDISGFQAMQVDVHSLKAGKASFAIVMLSENEASEGIDYFLANVPIDWSGWKTLTIPFSGFESVREPVGLTAIDSLRMASTGYRIKVTEPDAVLKFDNLRLIPKVD